MVNAIAALIGAQLVGELLRQLLHLPLPGPVIGMFLLAVVLLCRRDTPKLRSSQLTGVSDALIANMGLLFIPAGVGIVTESQLLHQYWLPILVGLVVSTILGLLATALVMHHTILRRRNPPSSGENPA